MVLTALIKLPQVSAMLMLMEDEVASLATLIKVN